MKKFFCVLVFAFLCAELFAQQAYKIGDIGPAGGIIFYDKGFSSDGWRYLEAAPVEFEFEIEWDTYTIAEELLGEEVGSGKKNTQTIDDVLNQYGLSSHNDAAQICAQMNINGFRDWFLPSGGELDLMYENLRQKGLGGFSNAYYCTSSPAGSFYLSRHFRTGEYYPTYKGNLFRVRAIRQFQFY